MNTFLWELNESEIWVEIPKNGSYNLKQLLFNYDSRYDVETQPDSKIKKIDKIDKLNHKKGFVIIRNPIDRFKSLISHYFVSGSRVEAGKIWLDANYITNVDESNIANVVLDNWNHIGKIREPHHFNSQASFIPDTFFEIPHNVYDLNQLSSIFGVEYGINSSNSDNIKLDDNCIDKISYLYKDDLNLYEKYLK